MRTVKRDTYPLNPGKQKEISALCRAYAREKRYWLDVFATRRNQARISRHREVRNEALAEGYVPASGLQARMWKLALVDAAETWDKYWQAVFVEARRRISKNAALDENQRRYLFWLLKDYRRFDAALHGEPPVPGFAVDGSLKRLTRTLGKIVRSLRGKVPRVQVARSFYLDANCYTVFVENGTQYLKIMSLTRGKRITIPLSGRAAIRGNLRVVLDGTSVRVHVSQDVMPKSAGLIGTASVDLGYTEVLFDEQGNGHGNGFGAALTAASNRRHGKGQARNRLHALEKKHRAAGRIAKANRIKKYNLGRVKLEKRTTREQAHVENIVNRAINAFLRERKPALVVSEDLRHAFTFDRPKGLNRKLSAWTKGVLQDRLEFKVLAGGSRHEQVNPAYGSQTCPRCGFVDAKNRTGDRFLCLHCGYGGHADKVAALNYLHRKDDPRITRYTPYREVKILLLAEFHRRLEARCSSATVPGRTLDAVGPSASTGGLVTKTGSSSPHTTGKRGGGRRAAGNPAA